MSDVECANSFVGDFREKWAGFGLYSLFALGPATEVARQLQSSHDSWNCFERIVNFQYLDYLPLSSLLLVTCTFIIIIIIIMSFTANIDNENLMVVK